MNNLTQQDKMNENQQDLAPLYCTNCYKFFGSPQNDNMCSKCYKEKQQKNNLIPEQNLPTLSSQESISQKIEKMCIEEEEERKIDIQIEQQQQPVQQQQNIAQTDTKKCWSCPRKVGYLGYKCKCEYVYCKFHRLPEDHECTFDYKALGKTQLAQANPQVIGSKLEQI